MQFNIEEIKSAARAARKSSGTPITTFLNQYARQHGFHTWESFLSAQSKKQTSFLSVPAVTQVIAPIVSTLNPHRKLLVMGLNALIDRALISIEGGNEIHDHVFLELAGEPSVIQWHGIGYDELAFAVWWKYDHSKHPQANLHGNSRESFQTLSPLAKSQHYPRFVGAFASGWLERRVGKYIQGEGARGMPDKYIRKADTNFLKQLPDPTPNGFLAEGPLHM